MSATIVYEPTGYRESLKVSMPSEFIDFIQEIYGSLPITLDGSDMSTIRALAVVRPDLFSDLKDKIDEHISVRILVEY